MRDRILEKAEELFRKYGIKRVTMDEISSRLGISKKTIYQSFADKNELVSEIFDKHICLSHQRYLADRNRSENAVHEVLIGSETFCNDMQVIDVTALYDLEKYHPDIFKKFLDFKNDFLYASITQNLKRGIEEELYNKDVDIEVIARLRMSTVVLALNIELYPVQQFRFADVEREITLHYLNGIATDKGARIIKEYMNRPEVVHHTLN